MAQSTMATPPNGLTSVVTQGATLVQARTPPDVFGDPDVMMMSAVDDDLNHLMAVADGELQEVELQLAESKRAFESRSIAPAILQRNYLLRD